MFPAPREVDRDLYGSMSEPAIDDWLFPASLEVDR